MVLAKSKNSVGLGNSLMNDRFGKGKGGDRKKFSHQGIQRVNHTTGETYVTNERQEASWVKMRSVTEQAALDEFLSTAELAGTDFTAEKMNNVQIIHTDQKNPYLLSATEEKAVAGKHRANKDRLTVPRRPHWDESTTPQELDRKERDSLLNWRRGLAELQENQDLLMTPFERNIEVWRQLWRVIERSDLVVQIVDARNPLLFRSEDLENYVKEVDPKKQNLLLVNKADMMTFEQRKEWAMYFKKAGIAFRFFSAHLAKEMNELRELEDDAESSEAEASTATKVTERTQDLRLESESEEEQSEDDEESEFDESMRILTVDELEELFLAHSPELEVSENGKPRKTQIGLVGYPNVGKSSTINALIGAKKVSVSSTPGKTKHFQTIHLSDKVVLCDCPGLVFPNFATTKAELVCNGVLPIDQLREYTGPASLVARRIPKSYLEAMYGMTIVTRPSEEGGTGIPTAEELLKAYAKARGFARQGQGQPDESRAARFILKDYVNGKLLFCKPPPGEIDEIEFNEGLYDEASLPERRRHAFVVAAEAAGPDDESIADSEIPVSVTGLEQGAKSKALDGQFFANGRGNAGHVRMPFNYKYTEQGAAASKEISGRKLRALIAQEKGVDPSELRTNNKKHFKGMTKSKGKRRANYFGDDD